MKANRKVARMLLGFGCVLSLSITGILTMISHKENSANVSLHAVNSIETSEGVTLNANDVANFNGVANWREKTIVFEVKTDGSETQFQLRDPYVGCGIIRTKPDRDVHTADEVAYENQGGSPYWGSNCYSVDIGDGWYRWVVDLHNYKCEANPEPGQLTSIKCLKGNNVQVRNLKFYDGMYIESTNLCGNSYGYLKSPLPNYASQTVQFDMKLTDSTQRRIQICKDSGGGLTGLIVCSKTELKVENPAGSPYLIAASTTPVSLGSDWYRFVLDLSEVKRPDNRTGTETAVKIKNIPDDKDGNPLIEMRNFKQYVPEDDPSVEADIILKSGQRTNIPDIDLWSQSTISFEVYHDSLDLTCDPQFIFGEKGQDKNITSYFGYKDIYGETALYLRNASDGDYWVKSTNQPEEVESGWYKWTINLSELRPEGSSGAETIGNIFNRGANDVYLRNFKVESTYDPSTDADIVLKAGQRTTLPDIPSWSLSTISFEVYHPSLDLICDPQFIFGEKGKENNITGYFGYKNIYGETGLYLRNASEGDYWAKSTNQPEEVGFGWYKWTIDLSELRPEGSSGAETIGNILNRGANDVYLRNFKIESVYDPSSEADIILKAGEISALPTSINYWQYSTIEFDIYHNSLDLTCDPQFQLYDEVNAKINSGFFGYKNIYNEMALYLRNANVGDYWIKSSNQPVSIGGGWYHWTINLKELGIGESGDGTETMGKMRNRGAYDVYIKNFTVTTGSFVMLNQKEITVPFEEGLTAKLSAKIIDGTGELVYTSSDESVASVDNKGTITFLKKGNCVITVSVKDNDSIREAKCNVSALGLKEHVELNLDDLTNGENSIEFPLVNSKDDNIKTYSYNKVAEDNPSVVVRFLVSATYLEQNRQAITIWGASENGLSDGNYGMWAVCWKGALVFDIFGSNGSGGINVNGINTTALNSHNTLVANMVPNVEYYVEAGAIDLEELINDQQYSYFYIKVNGNLVWSMLDVADEEYRNPVVAFTAAGASRCKAKVVDLVNVDLVTPEGTKTVEVAKGLRLPEMKEPTVTDPTQKFIGWKKDDGTIWNYDSDIVEGPMTLTSYITSDYCTIDFDLNYDDKGLFDAKYTGTGMYIKEPVGEPERDGYRFKWWSSSENGNAYDFYKPINEDVTLYAVWVKTYRVNFVYEGMTYLAVDYDENSYIEDPKWGYKDIPDFGQWLDRGMFELNDIAGRRAPYFALEEGGERVDFTKQQVKVTSEMTIYIQFAEIETVKADDEKWDYETSKWDYVSIRDLDDTAFKTDEYYVTKYDTSTAEYTPSINNTTDSVIFLGELMLGDKFACKNVNIGTIALRSNINAYNSINVWLRTKEVYLETKENSRSVHLAFQSYERVEGIEQYIEIADGVSYLKTGIYIPIEFGILAVTTPGFEDYDRVYFMIDGHMVFDVIIPKYGKSAEGSTYRLGFVTDGDTAANSALSIKGVYPVYTIEFKDAEGNVLADSVELSKYSYVEKPDYQLPEVEGKEFVGWYDLYTKQMWNFNNDKVTRNMVLIPTYGYKVTLDPNEGKFADGRTDGQKYNPRTQSVGEGCKISFPEDPIMTDAEISDGYIHTFAGWEKQDGTLWDKDNDVVTQDITLIARWDTYVTVTYYVEDVDYKWESKNIKLGSVVGSPRHGDPDSYDAYDDDEHEFLGWFTYDESGDFVQVDLETLKANDNLNLYAIFDEIPEDKPNNGNNNDNKGCGGKGCAGMFGGNIILLSALLVICKVKNSKQN